MKDPNQLFQEWYQEALTLDVTEPTAMALATADASGKPSLRIILLKGHDETGFYFYTNLNSRKGSELTENPYAALCFYWDALGKQIRIEGKVTPVTQAQADQYFASRSRESRIGAWASKQSQPMEQPDALLTRVKEKEAEFAGQDVPRPEHWSGFCLKPSRIEFWQNKPYRLHQRDLFIRDGKEWKHSILYP